MRKILFLSAVLGLFVYQSAGQGAVDTLRYVDFHIHTTMKNYYRDVAAPSLMSDSGFVARNNIETANWDGYKHRKKFKSQTEFSGYYGKKSYPQASYDILQRSGASVLFTSITPLEHTAISPDLVWLLRVLPLSLRTVNKLFVTKQKIKRQKVSYNTSSYEEFSGELAYMAAQKELWGDHKRPVQLVKNRAELEHALQAQKIALVLTLEGGHILYGHTNTRYYKHWDCMDESEKCLDEILSNIKKNQNSAL